MVFVAKIRIYSLREIFTKLIGGNYMDKNLIYLRASKGSQERLIDFICASQKLDNTKIVGIGLVKKNISIMEEGEKIIIVNNEDNLSKEELLKSLNIDNSKDVEIHSLELDLEEPYSYNAIKAFKLKDIIFIPLDEAIDDYKNKLKNKKVLNLKKSKLRRNFEKSIYSKEDIEQIYKDLKLPEDPTIDKIDFLEYYLFFGNNIELYKFINPVIKSKNMSWKDARKISVKDVNEYLAR